MCCLWSTPKRGGEGSIWHRQTTHKDLCLHLVVWSLRGESRHCHRTHGPVWRMCHHSELAERASRPIDRRTKV